MKEMVLDHIIYEFQTYFHTFARIRLDDDSVEQPEKNCHWIGHCISLRNIVRFFLKPSEEKMGKDDYSKDDLFFDNFIYDGEKYFIEESIKSELIKIKKKIRKINKAVCHLTEKRFDWEDNEPLDYPIKRLIDKAVYLILELIRFFIDFLFKEKDHNIKYETYKKERWNISEELNDPIINSYINCLKEYMAVVERLLMEDRALIK